MTTTILHFGFLLGVQQAALQDPGSLPADPPVDVEQHCPVDVDGGIAGGNGGMAGSGWDGSGQGSATVFWHVEGTTPDFTTGQRAALITAMQAWAGVVQIDFVETPVANIDQSIDLNFFSGTHCGNESHECGDTDCPFDGPGGTLAHAGFPPGVNQTCGGNSVESFSGNVHFDEAETWEQDNAGGVGPFSLTFVACHEIGHAIGLTHDTSGGGNVMRPNIGSNAAFNGLSANDIANIQNGYAAGTGSVLTLEDIGIWVNEAYTGVERGNIIQPFDTVTEGANGVPPETTDVVIHIQAGNYPETPRITKAMILRKEGAGSAIIGN